MHTKPSSPKRDTSKAVSKATFRRKRIHEIVLPEEEPETFEKILQYLYYGKIEEKRFDTEVRQKPEQNHMTLLAKIYVVADRFCMEDC